MRRTRAQLRTASIGAIGLLSIFAFLGLNAPARIVSAFSAAQETTPATCREIDRSFIEFDVDTTSDSGFEPGRVLSANDGTLAAIVITSEVDANGAVTKLDYATSVRVNAIILHTAGTVDIRRFDPAVRSGTGVSAGDSKTIDSISFCYQVSIPSPPKATTAEPVDATEEPTVSPTSTVLTLDVSAVKTAEARIDEIAATATQASIDAESALATAHSESASIAASATAAAATSAQNESELAATIAAQTDALGQSEIAASDARATVDALQATLSAPTQTTEATETPAPTATSEPIPTEQPDVVTTRVVYETTGETPFADWQPVDGWDLDGSVAQTDGSGNRGWLVVPVPTGLSVDAIVDVEFRVTGGEVCPRNFGIGMRGSATGFYAAGIEWACDPGLVLWAGSEVVGAQRAQPLPDPGDGWHTLQISTIGDLVTVTVDDVAYVSVQDNRYPAGNLVAFWTDRVGLEIRRVQVSEVVS